MPFLDFFQHFACGAENLSKTGLNRAWGELDNQFGRPKKMFF